MPIYGPLCPCYLLSVHNYSYSAIYVHVGCDKVSQSAEYSQYFRL